MGRPGRIVLRGISGRKALMEARMEVDAMAWYARRRMEDRAAGMFTVDRLVSLVAPAGGVVDRAIGGVNVGMAAFRGILGAIRNFRSGGGRGNRC